MEREWYVFTFGVAHPYARYVVKIYGTYEEAREAMFLAHGKKWAFQYNSDKGADLIADYNYEVLAEFMATDYVDAEVE